MNDDSSEQPPILPSERIRRARASLLLDDDALFAECYWEAYIASGPGGQHRNKTESAIRLFHPATGLRAQATERRSQPLNRAVALERLREKLQQLTFVPKTRKKTAPSRSQKRKRLTAKRILGEKKRTRSDRGDD